MIAHIWLKDGSRLVAEFSDVVSREFHITDIAESVGNRDGALRAKNTFGGAMVIRNDEIRYIEVLP